jgi:hypothetical protein
MDMQSSYDKMTWCLTQTQYTNGARRVLGNNMRQLKGDFPIVMLISTHNPATAVSTNIVHHGRSPSAQDYMRLLEHDLSISTQ